MTGDKGLPEVEAIYLESRMTYLSLNPTEMHEIIILRTQQGSQKLFYRDCDNLINLHEVNKQM